MSGTTHSMVCHIPKTYSSNSLFIIRSLSRHAYILGLPACFCQSRNLCAERMKQKMLKIKYYLWLISI